MNISGDLKTNWCHIGMFQIRFGIEFDCSKKVENYLKKLCRNSNSFDYFGKISNMFRIFTINVNQIQVELHYIWFTL